MSPLSAFCVQPRDIAVSSVQKPISFHNFIHACSQSITEKDGVYFITFTCTNWIPLFKICNAYDAVYNWFNVLKAQGHYIIGYVIMPHNAHAVIAFCNTGKSINTIISNGKRFIAYDLVNRLQQQNQLKILKQLHQGLNETEKKEGKLHSVFETSFDWKECRTEKFIQQKLDYPPRRTGMHWNPCKGNRLAELPEQYAHSAAKFYLSGEQGVYPVIILWNSGTLRFYSAIFFFKSIYRRMQTGRLSQITKHFFTFSGELEGDCGEEKINLTILSHFSIYNYYLDGVINPFKQEHCQFTPLDQQCNKSAPFFGHVTSFKTNTMRKIIYLLFAGALIFTCSNTFAQTSVVMKALDGTTKLNGGSIVAGHMNEIDILSNSHGEDYCSSCAKPTFADLSIMTSLSPATISFKKLLLNGTKLTSVDITYIKQGTTPVEYYKIRMENVTVTSVQESASSEIPTIAVSLAADRVAWQQIKTAGTPVKSSYGWDVANNVEWSYNF